MKTVYVLYRRAVPKAPYTPIFYNGALTAYEDYESAFSDCDLEKEVIVKARLITPDQISDINAKKRTLKQYAFLNKGKAALNI